MLKIAICDDEKLYRDLFSSKTQKAFCENIGLDFEIVCFSCVNELYEHIKIDKPNIVFLDIMINEINSVDWLSEHQPEFGNTAFIIMTAFPTETENLSEIDCCYYLLKDKASDERILRALNKAIEAVSNDNTQLNSVSFGNKNYIIDYHSVLYVESFKNNQLFHCTDNSTITVYSTMKKLVEKLPPYFCRCHKSYVVNMDFVTGYEPYNFTVSDEIKIPIPPKRYKTVISHYTNYIANL